MLLALEQPEITKLIIEFEIIGLWRHAVHAQTVAHLEISM